MFGKRLFVKLQGSADIQFVNINSVAPSICIYHFYIVPMLSVFNAIPASEFLCSR